ncbi:MAG TPA: GTP 3',8-cyclase MoaA [Candidatus Thermoplasmatota archaeon]|jgi:cyclic pyranopterin phosphate synthase|nr:GTP 3',8-cyclase MoaA [Candidatus Thermoplasmatota archaeon]
MLVDAWGRPTTDLRISLTDRCNFRCVFCHNEGQGEVHSPSEPAPGEMSLDHALRLGRIAHEFGVANFKLTGGEPLVRRDCEAIVAGLASLGDDVEVSMTTNGSMLAGRATRLRQAGLARVNVSVHSARPDDFTAVTGGQLAPVLAGVGAALEAGLTPVKLNMVVFKPTAAHIPEMVDFVASHAGLHLQLIEFMPELVGHRDWRVDIGAIHAWLAERADRVEVRAMHHRRVYHIGASQVEVVDPVGNEDFCANCHRVRVTAQGELKGCLNVAATVPTQGLDDAGIRAAFRRVVAERAPYYGGVLQRDARGQWRRADLVEASARGYREAAG